MKALEILKDIKDDDNFCNDCNGLDYCNNFKPARICGMRFDFDEAITELEALQLTVAMLEAHIAEFQKPKSCYTCKHREDYNGEFTCKFLDDMVNTPPQEPYGIYLQDADRLCCIDYEPKEQP